MRLAEQLVRLTGDSSPTALDTLAVAYAAAGRLEDAITAATRALQVARAAGAQELVEMIRMRLDTFERQRPRRQ